MKDVAKRFEAYCEQRGLRVTAPRLAILEAAYQTHRHFSAEQLHGWLRRDDVHVSLATVYRALALLKEGGFLVSLDLGRGETVYEHVLGHRHHDHMICSGCGMVVEFRCADIERLQKEQAIKHGFTLDDHSLRLWGTCAVCAMDPKATASGKATAAPPRR